MKKYIIAYVTDGGDLYQQEFKSNNGAQKWLDENEDYKAILIIIDFDTKKIITEDRT